MATARKNATRKTTGPKTTKARATVLRSTTPIAPGAPVPSARPRAAVTPGEPATGAELEDRVVAFAEQLGRMVGTVQARTEGWLDPKNLQQQMATIRDGAADVLDHLAGGVMRGRKAAREAAAHDIGGRSGGKVDAPGKRHRAPMPSTAGVKKSDERIAKLKAANASRHRSRG